MPGQLRKAAVCLFALLTISSLRAATLQLQPDRSTILIHGSSNIVRFTCRVHSLEGNVQADVDGQNAPTGYVRAAVDQITCGPKARTRHFREAMDAQNHPAAEFRLLSVNRDATPPVIEGTLSVAGRDEKITVPSNLTVAADGSLRATGQFPLRMTDFGIKPPRRMGGLLRVHDEVTVSFDLQFSAPQ